MALCQYSPWGLYFGRELSIETKASFVAKKGGLYLVGVIDGEAYFQNFTLSYMFFYDHVLQSSNVVGSFPILAAK